ncbi:signal transduction histidine kinase [Duganella sp. 1411]|jgi:signal transduction histidine kinase|uniref:ATP-binding protein n=1 Tax=Duganella sp. 1411 TaxID=2806572 RepID=UPI001AE4CDAB|nr:ATP-binding protein [Duganella sp. 1411]MBP1203846.1 signal transduction histidine kinase [Duganella sp. 1411]
MRRRLLQLLPQSLLGRLTLVMVAGLLVTQLAASIIWAGQSRAKAQVEAQSASQYMAHSASGAIRFFRSLPANYRLLLIQQLREMGGTRFFVNLNRAYVPVARIAEHPLARSVIDTVGATLKNDLPHSPDFHLAFAWPDQLVVSENGVRLGDLPDAWVQHILLLQPDPAPILVIQTEIEPGNWLYMAALMPNPYFLSVNDPLAWDRLALQGLSLAAVLVLCLLVVRWITRPLAALSEAAAAFGNGQDDRAPPLPEGGSREFVNTARAFSAMRERIQRYIEDRDRLFISISHDLRTPITRLKLRSELLDDEALRNEFEEDLDELDMMVKGALQCVKDSDIHENPAEVKLDALLGRLVRSARLAGHEVGYRDSGLSVRAKPLALKRAIGNLLDNALFYGDRAEIDVRGEPGAVAIAVRDHGPGVPEEAFASLFEPYVRLEHGRGKNDGGMGLGLGIARSIIEAHGGQLLLENHPEGGLNATIRLPA